MNCMFKDLCGREGKRTHLIKGPSQSQVEVLYLCDECRKKYQDSVKRLEKEMLTPDQAQELLNQFRKGKFMTEITDNKILIPISHENQKFVENICTNGGYTFQTFFDHLLNLYKRSLNEPLTQFNMQEELAKPENVQKIKERANKEIEKSNKNKSSKKDD